VFLSYLTYFDKKGIEYECEIILDEEMIKEIELNTKS
jgi:hypothetical protein